MRSICHVFNIFRSTIHVKPLAFFPPIYLRRNPWADLVQILEITFLYSPLAGSSASDGVAVLLTRHNLKVKKPKPLDDDPNGGGSASQQTAERKMKNKKNRNSRVGDDGALSRPLRSIFFLSFFTPLYYLLAAYLIHRWMFEEEKIHYSFLIVPSCRRRSLCEVEEDTSKAKRKGQSA